jgi:2-(1,2-epoxy-1,2-dihydrophenyl)acetyl-CoA isomerase
LHKAKELALLGNTITAEEADRLGLLNRLCSDDEVDRVAGELAREVAALPPRTVELIKSNLNRGTERSLAESLEAEGSGQALVFGSADTQEAVAAWLAKRDPHFTGR